MFTLTDSSKADPFHRSTTKYHEVPRLDPDFDGERHYVEVEAGDTASAFGREVEATE